MRPLRLLSLSTMAVASVMATSTAAVAAPPAPRHCVAALPAAQATCFDSFRAAITYATGGTIIDAPDATVAATDPAFATRVETSPAATTAVSVVLGIEYADANYGGATLTLTGLGGCDTSSDVDWQVPTMPPGWNDRISSFRSFNRCEQQLYRDIYYHGVLTPVLANSSYVGGTANDRASSIRFF